MHTASWVLLAGAAMVVLSVWLPVAGARRWAPARWRPAVASLGAAAGLALTLGLTVLSITALSTG